MNSNPLSTSNSSASPAISAETVSRRAYELWEQEGRPEGCDLRHWLQAEQELALGHASNGSNGHEGKPSREAAPSPSPAAARSTGTDTRPLAGTRAGAATAAQGKRSGGSKTPFDRNAAAAAPAAPGARRR